MWKKIKKLMLYAMLEPEQFEKVQPLAASENAFTLKLATIVQTLYFGFSLISSLGVSTMSDKKLAYGCGTFIPLIALILLVVFAGKRRNIIPWLLRLTCAGLLLAGLLCTLICTPDELTILLLIFFFCIPLVFVLRPIELIALILCTDAIYFIFAPFAKSPEVLSMDMIDIGIFSTLSMIIGVSHMQGTYRRFWLETEAVDLAEVRYQAAFKDQLTGAYNRNAYNRDTEHLGEKPLPDDFMYIALDLNGLKTANDTFGHIAGDELINGAVQCMENCFGSFGKVYRIGGDEFTVILNRKGKTESEILGNFNREMNAWHGNLVQQLSISYGVVRGHEAANMPFHEIELLADKRMYQEKAEFYKQNGVDRRKF